MKNVKILGIIIIGILIMGSAASCSQGDLQERNDILLAQLTDANAQLAELQQRLFEAQILEDQYDELNTLYDNLKAQNDANLDEIESLGITIDTLGDEIDVLTNSNEAQAGEIAELTLEYNSLKAQYNLLVGLESGISEENIAQALFDLIKQERISYGLNALETGHNLEDWSLINSQNMAFSKEIEYYTDSWVPFQRVFIAAGYSSLDRVVNAAMITWKSHALFYEENILSEDAVYGAVSVAQLGDIYYITYMASNFP